MKTRGIADNETRAIKPKAMTHAFRNHPTDMPETISTTTVRAALKL